MKLLLDRTKLGLNSVQWKLRLRQKGRKKMMEVLNQSEMSSAAHQKY